jgi:hypothetical protein
MLKGPFCKFHINMKNYALHTKYGDEEYNKYMLNKLQTNVTRVMNKI